MRKVKNLDKLVKVIDEAFANYFNKQDTKMENQPLSKPRESEMNPVKDFAYLTIKDYTRQTGKRFRMTKDQKARDLSREQAFMETFGEHN
tara:strand:- start:2495 stop:2764 length:270 start_codon:yes stop_codon:yes gene_type:complete